MDINLYKRLNYLDKSFINNLFYDDNRLLDLTIPRLLDYLYDQIG